MFQLSYTIMVKNSFPLAVCRYKMDKLKKDIEKEWDIKDAQPFFPTIEYLFKTENLSSYKDFGLELQNRMTKLNPEYYRKTSMIHGIFKTMQGKTTSHKLENCHNAVFVGAFISALLSQTKCQHFADVYGIFTGIATSLTVNISDDYEDIFDCSWFSANKGKTFNLKLTTEMQEDKPAIQLGDITELEGVEELDAPAVDAEPGDLQSMSEESTSISEVFDIHSESCSVASNCESELEDFAWATFKNVPVITTVMEKCEDTLHKLLQNNSEEKYLDWISQVIFALAYAQQMFGLVHNDLHSNNIMYVPTKTEFLYYRYNSEGYRIPTHGYLIKIIDFERSTAQIRLAGMKDSRILMSDHFAPDEEAYGQYNYGPYYTKKYQTIKPNTSFDLCRLATSLYWDIFPTGKGTGLLYDLFVSWLTQEDGTPVFHLDRECDRYPGFEIYKAIARYCNNAVPAKQIEKLPYKCDILPQYDVLLIN